MNFKGIIKTAERLSIDNSPAILTGIGAVGTAATAYLTGKASFIAAQLIHDAQHDEDLKETGHDLTKREKVELVWKEFVVPVSAGTITIASIVYANRVSTKRAAALAAAYTLSDKAFGDYKEKVVEKLGIKKEQAARDELAQEKVDKNPSSKNQIFVTGNGDVVCYDLYTGRYFNSSMESLRKAENEVNLYVIHNGRARLNDLYNHLGLSNIKMGDEVGWTPDRPLDIEYSTTMTDDSRPAISIDYQVTPIRICVVDQDYS